MPNEMPNDPRDALVKTKYFNQYPQPLERWLWKQGLPQAAERVFWLHWTEGRRNGDWCSEIPLKRVALECCVDLSTVTRSYQLLKSLGLLRRQDPGRNPNNPFCQATAITEVRLPRAFLADLGRSPNRAQKDSSPTTAPAAASAPESPPELTSITTETTQQIFPEASSVALTASVTPRTSRPSRQDTQALWSRASDGERARYFIASKDRLTHLDFDPHTRLTPDDRGWILAQLAQLAIAKPTQAAPKPDTPPPRKPTYQGPRRLSVLDLARTRKRILDCVPGAAAQEIFRQVIWAVEEGALRRFDLPLALNIAVKKIREGAWSRPNVCHRSGCPAPRPANLQPPSSAAPHNEYRIYSNGNFRVKNKTARPDGPWVNIKPTEGQVPPSCESLAANRAIRGPYAPRRAQRPGFRGTFPWNIPIDIYIGNSKLPLLGSL